MECFMKVTRTYLFVKGNDKIKSSPANTIKNMYVFMCMYMRVFTHTQRRMI